MKKVLLEFNTRYWTRSGASKISFVGNYFKIRFFSTIIVGRGVRAGKVFLSLVIRNKVIFHRNKRIRTVIFLVTLRIMFKPSQTRPDLFSQHLSMSWTKKKKFSVNADYMYKSRRIIVQYVTFAQSVWIFKPQPIFGMGGEIFETVKIGTLLL